MKALRVLIALLLLALAATSAEAASCLYPEGTMSDHVKREFQESDNVFSATVVGIGQREIGGYETRIAALRINRAWKGSFSAGEHIDVIADGNYQFIGSGFEAPLNAEIIVFASPWKNMISLSSCSLTGYVSGLEDQIPLLDSLGRIH